MTKATKLLSSSKVDDDQIKRQAARFRLFEVDGAEPRPAQPAERPSRTVHLVNKKAPSAATRRWRPRPGLNWSQIRGIPDRSGTAVNRRRKRERCQVRHWRVSGTPSPAGRDPHGQEPEPAGAGRLRLLVVADQPGPAELLYEPGWHDDTSDGPVTARIRLANGSTIDDITGLGHRRPA